MIDNKNNQNSTAKSYLVNVGGKTEVWDEATYTELKDALYSKYPDASMFEMDNMTDFSAVDDEMQYVVNIGDRTETWDAATMKELGSALKKKYPNATVQSLKYKDYWYDKALADEESIKTMQGELEALNKELGGKQRWSPEYSAIDAQINDKRGQMAQAKSSYDANPRVVEANERYKEEQAAALEDYNKKYLPNLRNTIIKWSKDDVDLREVAKEDRTFNMDPLTGEPQFASLKEIKSTKKGGGLVARHKMEQYQSALAFLNKAERIRNEHSSFGEGMKNTAMNWMEAWGSQSDIKTYQEIYGILKRLEKTFGNLNEVSEEALKANLTKSEQALILAFFEYSKAQAEIQDDASWIYEAGGIAAEAIPFMLEFIATGGLASAAGKVVPKGLSKAMTSWIKGATKGTFRRAARKVVAKGVRGAVRGVTQAAVITPLRPTAYTNVMKSMTQIDKDGKLKDSGSDIAIAIADEYIETLSELSGGAITSVLGGVGKGVARKFMSKGMYDTFATWGKKLSNMSGVKLAKSAQFHGLPVEMSEEYFGNALREMYDAKALDKMHEGDNFWSMLVGFLPMTVITGGMGVGQYLNAKNNVNKGAARLGDILAKEGYKDDQIEAVVALAQELSPYSLSEKLDPILTSMTKAGASKESRDAVIKYAMDVVRYKTLEGTVNEPESTKRQEKLDELTGKFGTFYQTKNEGTKWQEENVTTAKLNNGSIAFLTSGKNEAGEFDAIDINTGNKIRITESDIASAKDKNGNDVVLMSTRPLNTYLTELVMEERQNTIADYEAAYNNGQEMTVADLSYLNEQEQKAKENLLNTGIASRENSFTGESLNLSSDELLTLSEQDEFTEEESNAIRELAIAKRTNEGLIDKLKQPIISSIDSRNSIASNASNNETLTVGTHNGKTVYVKGGVQTSNGKIVKPDNAKGYPVEIVDAATGEVSVVDSKELTNVGNVNTSTWNSSYEAGMMKAFEQKIEELRNATSPNEILAEVYELVGKKVYLNINDNITLVEVDQILPSMEVLIKGKKGDLGGKSVLAVGIDEFYNMIYRDANGNHVLPNEEQESEVADYRGETVSILINGVPTSVEVMSQDNSSDSIVYEYTDENGNTKRGRSTISEFSNAIEQANKYVPEQTSVQEETPVAETQEQPIEETVSEEVVVEEPAEAPVENAPLDPESINWDELFEQDKEAYFIEMQNQFGEEAVDILNEEIDAAQSELDALAKAKTKSQNDRIKNRNKKKALQSRIDALNEMVVRLTTPAEVSVVGEVTETVEEAPAAQETEATVEIPAEEAPVIPEQPSAPVADTPAEPAAETAAPVAPNPVADPVAEAKNREERLMSLIERKGVSDALKKDSAFNAGKEVGDFFATYEEYEEYEAEAADFGEYNEDFERGVKASFANREQSNQYHIGDAITQNDVISEELGELVAEWIRHGGNFVVVDKAQMEQELSNGSSAKTLETPDGVVYGFVKDGVVYLNPSLINPNSAIHEYTHLWDNALMQLNPELWAKGKALMKQTPIWDEVLNDPNYADIKDNEDLVASEVHSRLVGERGAERLNQLEQQAREEGLTKSAKKLSILGRLREWLNEATKWLKSAFAQWNNSEIESIELSDFLDMPLSDLANFTQFTIGNNAQTDALNSKQTKEPGGMLTDEQLGINQIQFSISKNNRATIETWLNKRPDLKQKEKDAFMLYIDNREPVQQLAMARWFSKGAIRLPEDLTSIDNAFKFARKMNVDPMKYDTPAAVNKDYVDRFGDEKKEDSNRELLSPDDARFEGVLTNKVDYGNGIVVYDVQNDIEHGQRAVRDLMNDHLGEEFNCWCLLYADSKGNPTKGSEEMWWHYNKTQKKVAFKDGKICAFCASTGRSSEWWDLHDQSHGKSIPVEAEVEGDKLGRRSICEFDGKKIRPVKKAPMYRGNKKSGLYEEWANSDPNSITLRTTRKGGKDDGVRETWDGKGNLLSVGRFKKGQHVGDYVEYASNGQVTHKVSFDQNGNVHGDYVEYSPKGQLLESRHYNHGTLDGESVTYNEKGQLLHSVTYDNGFRTGYEVEYNKRGKLLSKLYHNTYKEGTKTITVTHEGGPEGKITIYTKRSTNYGPADERFRLTEDKGSWFQKPFTEVSVKRNGVEIHYYRNGVIHYKDSEIDVTKQSNGISVFSNKDNNKSYFFNNKGKLTSYSGNQDKQTLAEHQEEAAKIWEKVTNVKQNGKSMADEMVSDMMASINETEQSAKELHIGEGNLGENSEAQALALDAVMESLDGYVEVEEVSGQTANEVRQAVGATNEFMVASDKPVFISNAAFAVANIKMEKATPAQWLAMLEKNGGLKAAEDKWMGLSDWLKESDKKTLTKQEVLDYIHENEIQIEEEHYSESAEDNATIVYGQMRDILQGEFNHYRAEYYEEHEDDDFYGNPAADYAIEKLRNYFGDTQFPYDIEVDNSGDVFFTFYHEDDTDMEKWAEKLGVKYEPQNQINSTRLMYTSDGLENKKEIALIVPTIKSWGEWDDVHFGDAGKGRAIAWVRFGDTEVIEDTEESKEIASALRELANDAKQKYGEKRSAWPNDVRAAYDMLLESELNSMRYRKILVIDEIQSKRHQEGRDKGYKVSREKADAEMDKFMKQMHDKYDFSSSTPFAEVFNEEEMRELARLTMQQNRATFGGMSVPDAPFEKNWHELAMKRMMRYAAENGYDEVAWTSGKQQSDRYNLGKVVNSIISADSGETKRVRIFLKNSDSLLFDVDSKTGKVVSVHQGDMVSVGSNLSDVVGKDMADGILNNTGAEDNEGRYHWSGEGLRVGTSGMAAFYDKMLPTFMNKYGKKWGISVSETELPMVEADEGYTFHSVPVTKAMKDSVMEGQPMFMKRPNGTVYGWTDGKKIYLTEAGFNPNTPIHEYTHLWAKAMMKNNPKGWNSVKSLLKNTPIWDEVINDPNYSSIKNNEDAVASEALSRLSGSKNAAKMEQMAQQMIDEAKGTMRKAKARGLIQNMKDALAKFWNWVGTNLFKIEKFDSVEQVTDRVLWDLLNKTDLGIQDNGNGKIEFSISTWENGGRDYLVNWLKNDQILAEDEKADILARMDEFYENAQKYTDVYVPFGTWSEAAVKFDKDGNPLMSVIKKNGDYAMNLDFSLVCKKRRPLNTLLRELIKRNAFGTYTLRERELAEINWILQDHGFEVACALCFVDSKRFRVTGVADVFATLYNNFVKALAPEGAQIAHFNYSNNPNVESVENGIDTMSDEQLNWEKFDKLAAKYGPTTVEGKVAAFLRDNPSQRKLVDATDFIDSKGFEAVKEGNPKLLSLYNSKKGTGGPKASFGDVQYLNDILKKNNAFDVEKAYEVGGVRLQSFSDFVPHMYFDYMQLFAELAAKKLPAHAYTKEALFAKIFGMSGIKINMSLVPSVAEGGIAPGLDANGNYTWSEAIKDKNGNIIQQGQSFPFDDAMAIQNAEGYSKNCGVIAVGISDAHIEKMLGDPNIPFIIPYHKSSLNAIVARMTNIDKYKDYTKSQNTTKFDGTKIEGKDFNFNAYLHEHKEATPQQAAQAYLDWCKENNYRPKFSQFAYHQNYYKLLQDFNTVDTTTGEYTPQGAVTMTFPTKNSAFGDVETLIQQGLTEDVAVEEKMNSEMSKVADEVEARLKEIAKEPKVSKKKQASQMAKLADERQAKIKEKAEESDGLLFRSSDSPITPEMDAEYLAAVERGDMETAQRMVLEAAKLAMPNTKVVDENGNPKVVYHGSPYSGITEFDRTGRSVSGLREYGSYFSTNETLARLYAYSRRKAQKDIDAYEEEKARLESIAFSEDTPVRETLDAFDDLDRLRESNRPKVYKVFLNIENPKVFDAEGSNGWDGWHKLTQDVGYDIKRGIEAIEAISGHNRAARMSDKYDGIIAKNMADVHSDATEDLMGDVFLVFDENPNQIKSAEPVTYDDNGNVIPLSERFNPEKNDIRYRKGETVEEANERFNRQLNEFINSKKKNMLFELGNPHGAMELFLPRLPIVMRPRIINKASETKHNVDASALKNLPQMISEPIFVFKRSDNALGVLTEIVDRDGKNVCVAIELNKTIQHGQNMLEVNDIRSIHGRDAINIISPIINNKTLKYVDKAKGLNWLSSASYNYQQEIAQQDLDAATKIVKEFDNPSIGDASSIQNAAVDYLAGSERTKAIQRAVNKEASKLGVTVTYKTRSEMPKGHENDKGYYNTKTGEIVICTENNVSIADAIQTILHEAVAHKGLRQLIGDKFNEFINRVYNSLDAKTKAEVDALAEKHYNGDKMVAMEEYMASLAENENFAETSVWEKIKSIFENIINSILGRNDIQIGDKELRYILRASYNNMVNPNTMNTIEGWAKDTNMRNELGINEAIPEIMSRTGIDATEVARETAKQVYDKAVSEGWQEFQRQFQDAYQPVRIAIEAIQQETGNIPIEDYENYLLIQNQTSSRSRVEIDNFERKYYEPIIEQVNNIVDRILEARGMKNNEKNRAEVYAEVRQYMIAKHGLERNEYYRSTKGEDRDYAGLTSLFGFDPTEYDQAEEEAARVIDKFEKELGRTENQESQDINDLWKRINAATDKTLRHSYESGMISRQQYDQIRSMFNFYIPLRGFDETTAEDVYSYARFEGNRFNAAVHKAEGRTSVADDPIATIMNMAESEIAQGNKNRAKQALYNYLLNRAQGKEKQNSLMQVEDVWYVITKDENGNDVYSIASPNHEAGETWEEFENRMSTLEAEEKAVKSKKGHVDVGMRFQKKRNQNAHYIYLKINGVDKAIYINGDPKAADAVNGTYQQKRQFGEDKFRQINRFISSTFTNYSLEFTARNFFRDMFYSHINMGIKEKDPAYRKTFRKNWRSNNMGTMLKMLKAYRAGEYENKELNALESAFVEFMENGGQTGYTLINSVESHKKELEKSLERMRKGSRKGGLKNYTVFKYTLGGIELLNEASELITRFAAFKTSRDMGRSVVESINDAKEITVNFNTKGAQDGTGWMGFIAKYFGWSKYFFNASVQGVQNLKAMANANKLKFCGVVGAMMGLGFLMPVITSAIASMLGGDDDEYWNIPEYDRQNNLCICIGGGDYIKIPLPIGFREVYAMGDMTAALAFDKKFSRDIGQVGMDYANKIASIILPVNPLEGSVNGLSLMHAIANTLAPSSAQFVFQSMTNTDWKGAPLQKEYTFNANDPQWMKAFANAPDWLVCATKWLNENIHPFGDYRGVDWSPEHIDNFLSNVGGGVYTLIKKTGNAISAAWNEEERNLSNIPLVGVVFGTGIDSDGSFVTDAYFDMKKYYDANASTISTTAKNFGLSLEDIFVKHKGAHHPKIQEIYGNKNFEWMKDWYLGHEGNRKGSSKAEKLGLNQLKQDIKDLQKSIAEREERGMSTEKKEEKLIEKQKMFDEYYRDFTYRLLEMD